MKTTSLPLTVSILNAFADCHMADEREGDRLRNLQFRAAAPMPREEAYDVMSRATPHGYNAFEASLLRKLDASVQVTIAREGSVAIYVKGNPLGIKPAKANAYGENADAHPELKADEVSYDAATDETRIWWD